MEANLLGKGPVAQLQVTIGTQEVLNTPAAEGEQPLPDV